MNYDIYLGGIFKKEWREKLKASLPCVNICDPMVDDFDHEDVAKCYDQTAKQLYHIENGNLLVLFYLNSEWNGTITLLEIGDAIGRGKQVVVCLDGDVRGCEKIRRYCEFRGAILTYSIDEMIETVHGYLHEVKLCSVV